ncbi:hypothetical protein FAES_2544 [Fibrella aestuarina BUZ 2]|uniref:Thioredoxin domain-containing protein n=1 Tax=Fibrella aestuarina BUZ 2 TaxID=1166018 RepID=I0K8V0_9BACT|nr:redoxin domain-containing protein [Fibrella aestuarina]CCH00553.1 hypothetical protein FAES_2544 [Fibrella aestuarina BUZ 2]
MRLVTPCFVSALLLGTLTSFAQQTTPAGRGERTGMTYRYTIPDDAVIYDDSTGKRMTLAEFAALNRADPRGHRLRPAYNEYGKPDQYRYRRATREERETGHFNDRDPAYAPKPGQQMPRFVMKGTNGHEYRLTDLAGKPIILSFWVTLRPPFMSKAQLEALAKQITPAMEAGKLVSLGVTGDAPDQIANLLGAQPVPFVPVGDGRGFLEKFHVVSFPSVILIDKTGKVVANLSGSETQQLADSLKALN